MRSVRGRWFSVMVGVGVVVAGAAACADPEASGEQAGQSASAGGGDGGSGPAVSGSMEEVCAAAQKEGALVSWNSEDPDAYQKIFDAFSATYPGIELQSVNLRPDDITQRLVTEAEAGRGSGVDTLSLTQDKAGPLVDQGLLRTDIDWDAMGVNPDYVAQDAMVRTERIAIGLSYNTDLVDESQLPDTWEGLLDDQWAGKVVVDPRGDPLQLLAVAWGEDKTVDYVQRLADIVKPQIVQGATAGLLTVASGENLITTNGRSAETDEQQANGAPVEIHYLDVVPAVDYYTAVPTSAPHPNAGACWAAWLNSEDGRKAKAEYAFKGNVDLPPEAEGGELSVIATTDDVALTSETAEKISAIWAGRS